MANIIKEESKSEAAGSLFPSLIAPRADNMKDLVFSAKFTIRKRSPEQPQDYYEKGDSAGDDGSDYFEKKDWSDLYRAANPSSKVTEEQLKLHELYDIDGVLIRPNGTNNTLNNGSGEKAYAKQNKDQTVQSSTASSSTKRIEAKETVATKFYKSSSTKHP